jgi:flavorubredoxin
MKARPIVEGVWWMGAVDWDRRLFDSFIPLPEGTSYNAYLVRGSAKTALLDTVDPAKADQLLGQLREVEQVDYLVAHHAEQDHSGALPLLLARYPQAQVVTTKKGKGMLVDHLDIPGERVLTVEDGERLDLGGRSLEFIHTPWVHWPETMSSFLTPENILFSCDFFGSHLATSELFASETPSAVAAAKLYFAEIMMPFRAIIRKDLQKVGQRPAALIAPSHGPVWDRPATILEAYAEWVSETPKNLAAVCHVSMHGSTALMVERLVASLVALGVTVRQISMESADPSRLTVALVDAATLVLATPTVLAGAHPHVAYAALLTGTLRPKLRCAATIGSYGWGAKAPEQLAGLMADLKVEWLDPVVCRGLPRENDLEQLDGLAAAIAGRHRELGLFA